MTNTNHTPGPWSITLYCDDTFVSSSDGKTVCEISHSRDFTNPAKECISNARLIAAAPDLLAALGKIAFSDGSLHGTCVRDLQDIARSAIAKARGEG